LNLRIALVTFNFDPSKPGGVTNVSKNILETLAKNMSAKTEIISFSNSRLNPESIAILKPKSYKNIRSKDGGIFLESQITRVGCIGSELEIMRYRKRKELGSFFEAFDLIIIVTGVLQFANVVPRTKVPIIIQCATRLTWERKSQYLSMSRVKKLLLKFQIPILAIQEKRVLNSGAIFLVENTRMSKWVELKTRATPVLWYPGVRTSEFLNSLQYKAPKNRHYISVGRFDDPRKGWDRLFVAYKLAFERDKSLPDLVVIGVGNFSIENKLLLEEIISNCPIKILGNLDNLERDKKLQTADYFLQTSYEEGLGLAALEALSFGVPLICSDTDGSREYLVHGKNGILVPQGDNFIDNFKEAILISQKSEHHTLSKNARDQFKLRFSNEISETQLLSIIRKATSK